MDKKVIVILGPTATHKSVASLYLADRFPIEIISADSMQFYRGMDIGTAKVAKEIRSKVPHHMIDIIDISVEYSVADYKKNVIEIINGIISRERFPLIVGGSGLYIRAITENYPVENSGEPDFKLRNQLSEMPLDELRALASSVDASQVSRIGTSDRKRLMRVVEFNRKTGKLISSVENPQPEFQFLKIGMTKERNTLYKNVNTRVDRMFEEGLVKEVENLRNENSIWSKTSSQAIGYKEVLDYLEGVINLEEAKETIKQRTRNFAKRQITWFKKEPGVIWFDSSELESVLLLIENLVKEFIYEDK